MDLLKHSPILSIALPLLGAFTIPALSTLIDRRKIEVYSLSLLLGSFLFSLETLSRATRSTIVYKMGGWNPPIGIALEIDALGALLGSAALLIVFLSALFSVEYIKEEPEEGGDSLYYCLLMAMTAGLVGCFYTGDLFNLFVFLEILSVASYALIAFDKDSPTSLEAGLKYIIVSAFALTTYYLSAVFVYRAFGSLNMADVASLNLYGISISPKVAGSLIDPARVLPLIILLALLAFAIKSGLFPFHFWLPDAHPAAPAPISAILSGMIVKVALYAISRFYYTISSLHSDPSSISSFFKISLYSLGFLSILIGSYGMIRQRDIKRMLAYSTILNVGYIAVAISLGTLLGLIAAIFHMLAHALTKALLFLCSGVIHRKLGTRDLEEIGGVYQANRLFTAIYIAGALSIVGVPPLACFWGKMMIIWAAYTVSLPLAILTTAAILLGSITALMAQSRFIEKFFQPKEASIDLGIPIKVSLVLLLILVILMGVYPRPFIDICQLAASSLLNSRRYVEAAIAAAT